MNAAAPDAAASDEVTTRARLLVHADLTIEVDGTPAHLTSEGSRLVLTSPHPEQLWASVLAAALPAAVGDIDGPRAVGRLADGLVDSGLRLDVTGPRGTVIRLGAGVRSRLGRLATGSSAVGPGAPTAMASLVWQRSRRFVLGTAATLGAASVAAIALRRWTGRTPGHLDRGPEMARGPR